MEQTATSEPAQPEPPQPEPMPTEPPQDEPAGGESACLLALVCTDCGALADRPPPTACWRCGTVIERQ